MVAAASLMTGAAPGNAGEVMARLAAVFTSQLRDALREGAERERYFLDYIFSIDSSFRVSGPAGDLSVSLHCPPPLPPSLLPTPLIPTPPLPPAPLPPLHHHTTPCAHILPGCHSYRYPVLAMASYGSACPRVPCELSVVVYLVCCLQCLLLLTMFVVVYYCLFHAVYARVVCSVEVVSGREAGYLCTRPHPLIR